MNIEEASPLAQTTFDEPDFWDLTHPLCPLYSPMGLKGFNFFLLWRKKYIQAPAHFSNYEYLAEL